MSEQQNQIQTDTVEISRAEFEFYQQKLLPDFANLVKSLERMGGTLSPFMPTQQEAKKGGGEMSKMMQMKMAINLMPQIQKLLPELAKELEGHIMPICKKYQRFVEKYQRNE